MSTACTQARQMGPDQMQLVSKCGEHRLTVAVCSRGQLHISMTGTPVVVKPGHLQRIARMVQLASVRQMGGGA